MFTLILTTHNRPLLLRRALTSISQQSCRDFSIICVADHFDADFPNDTLSMLNCPVLCVLRNGEAGPALSCNIALKLVNTEYFMFLDDDDSLQPDHLEVFAHHLSQSQSDLVYCDHNVVDEVRWADNVQELSRRTRVLGVVDQSDLFVMNKIPNGCIMFKSEKFCDKTHDPGLLRYNDWDFLLRCLPNNKFTYINNPSLNTHITPNQFGDRRSARNDDKLLENLLRVYANNPSPTSEIRQARQKFLLDAIGIELGIENF